LCECGSAPGGPDGGCPRPVLWSPWRGRIDGTLAVRWERNKYGMNDHPVGIPVAAATTGEPGPEDVWRAPLEQLLTQLATKPSGLTGVLARSRLAAYGANDASTVKRSPLWLQFLARFRNPLVVILVVASGLSAVTGDVASFVIIITIVMLSIAFDFAQQVRAQIAVEALRRSVAIQAKVRRDGATVSVLTEQLVPGDIVELIAGDLVPADSRLLESRDLYVNQALLTGEPYPAEKQAGDAASGVENPAGASHAVFAGTSVISGTATILICRTGSRTALGHLATSLAEKPPATAFAVGIRRFGMLIMRFTILMVLFVLAVNIYFHRPALESLLFAVALAVGLTPELLPMIVTVTLARSAMRMAKQKVIVKRLSAIHDLGAMDVLCTDKTGTLTEATIKLVRVIDGNGAETASAFAYAFINSQFETGMKSPLDAAILGAHPFDMNGWKKIDEVPFDFERRRVSVLVEHEGKRGLIVKGAPEDLLRLSSTYAAADGVERPLDAQTRRTFEATLDGLGAQGFRALGIATRSADASHETAAITDETELVFAGFAVFLDPPKASAGATIRALADAGVSVKVLTGDNESVTRHVFKEIGVPVTGVLTGAALEHLTDEALLGQLPRVNLFCRVNPQQKHRVLLALKRLGHVVGFMGDGINDAPALHAADVGISVDGAADVARAAADLILLEHDLSVVLDAMAAGRGAVRNVSKYVLMGASSNFGNMFSMAGAALMLPFLPMLPIQILLNNLIYNVSEIAIPFDRVDPEAVARPVRWDIKLIERFMLVFGPVSSVFDFVTFYALLNLFHASEAVFQTGWFIESMTTQVLVVFCIRTRRRFYRSRACGLLVALTFAAVAVAIVLPVVPLVGAWFGFVTPPPLFFGFLIGATLAYLALVEVTKVAFYRVMGGS
jgi:Mg2+-importing ATPase